MPKAGMGGVSSGDCGTGNGLVLSGWSNACSFCLVFCCAGDRVVESIPLRALVAVCALRACLAFAGEVCC